MKPIDSSRVDVLARPGLAACNLVKLTTYTNRTTRAVSATYYFAERWTLYDGQQWLPAIRSFEFQRTAMPHLPDPVTDGALLSGLLTQLTVHLRNTVDPVTGAYLIRELSLAGLDGASVEWRELPLNLQGGESFVDLSALLGDEHVVRFRGDLLSVDAVDETDITLKFETPEPQIPWALLSDAANVDPLDLGKRKNIIYGAAKRVPLYGEIVGSLTTLAASAGIADTSLVLTDATGFPTAGSAMIGTEKVTWSSKSTNTLTGVARGTTGTLSGEHSAGAIIVELVALARFSVASHACKRIVNVYALSPFTGELHRITTAFNANASAGRIDFTSAQLQLLLDDLATAGATVTQQPAVSTQPVVSHPVTGTIGVMQVVGWSHSQMNDGDAFTVRTPATNFDTTPVWWRWNPPATGAVITSQTFTVRASGAGVIQFWDKDPYLNAAALVATVNPNNSGGNVGQYVFTTTNSVNQMYVSRSSGNCGVGEAFRTDVQFQQSAPTIPTPTAIAGSDATQVKVRGESVGFGLRLFADVDGYSVPLTSWTTLLNLDSDAANWTIPGGATIANEATIKSQGTGSLKVTTTTSGAASVRRALTGSADYSDGRRFAIAVRVENPAQLTATQGVAVLLSSGASFTNYGHFDCGTADGLAADGTFHTIEIDPASADASAGTGINLSNITHIQFYMANIPGQAAASFYFDDIRVSAIGAASPDFLATQGGLIEKAPDILRHLIATVLGQGHAALDTAWNEAGGSTYLNDNIHACVINYLGDSFSAVAGRLAFESRASLILEERISGSVYRMLVADNAYRWPGPVQTITEWAKLSEQSAERRERFSRFRALYAWDASKGDDAEAFAQLVRIDPEQNDVPDPATPELVDTEARIGRRDASVVSFFSIQDTNTAREVIGYYAVELSRSPLRRFALASVPWPEAYLLERGDVVRFAPPWEGGGTVSCRVVDIQRDPFRQMYDFDCVEVPTQETVQMHVGLTAALIPTAELFVLGEYLLAMSATATLTATASLTDNAVKLACALTATVIPTAQMALIGGVPLYCQLTAALTVTSAQLAQLGPIHLTAALSATLTSNAHLFQSMRCALTATLTSSARLEENRFLGGLVPIADGYPYSDAHRVSVNLNGTDEQFLSTTQTLGIANAWTIGIAFASAGGTTGDLLHILGGSVANQIRVYLDSSALRVYIYDSAGAAIKDYTFGAPGTVQTHVLLTWNGTTLFCWLNTIAQTPTQNTNNSGTMTDTSRTVRIGYGGAYFSGTVHSVAIWSSVLSTNERAELWNRGALTMRDLARNWRAYVSAANLQHWWRLGHNVSDIGKDYGRGTPIDVMVNALNISSADIEALAAPDGASLELDGTSEYLANTSPVALGVANSFTVAAWVYVDVNGSSADVFAADSNAANANRILIQYEPSSAEWLIQVSDGVPTFSTLTTTNDAAPVGEWQHVALVKDGTTTLKCYVNGIERASAASPPTTTNVARQTAIGSDQSAAHTARFNGRVHSVIMWDVALSAPAVASLWNGGMKDVDPRVAFGSYASQASLKHYWHVGPLGAVGVGGDIWVDEVPSGGVNLETNAANVTTADTSILRGGVGPGACLAFNGTNEYLANTADQTLGIANAWTMEAWLRCDDVATVISCLTQCRPAAGTNLSAFVFQQRGDIANDPWNVAIRDSGGTLLKQYLWDSLLTVSTWTHLVHTWDGTSLLLYKDGTLVTESSRLTDNAVTMADPGRVVSVGSNVGFTSWWVGRLARFSLWSSVLSATEVRQVWSRRLNVDLRYTFGAYVSQANLKHQWIMGALYTGASDYAVDRVASGGININTNSAGLGSDNVHTAGF